MSGLTFSWDSKKASANKKKHGVSFEEAKTAFFDEDALVLEDPQHSDEEDRFLLLGLSVQLRILVVCHALRTGGEEIRLISARKADKSEKQEYAQRLSR